MREKLNISSHVESNPASLEKNLNIIEKYIQLIRKNSFEKSFIYTALFQ